MDKNTRKNLSIPKYILESFYYIQEWQIPYLKGKKLFLLDSGAFTFMSNSKKQVNWDEYVEQYADFINKYDIKYFFELDIDVIVGIKEVERLRNKLEKLTNKKCIPVWHKSRGLEYWKKITKDYDYVAIGGIVTKEIKPNEYKYFIPLLNIAKNNKCKVHGLGFTNLKLLSKYHFYSVDSTSWKSGGRFGSIYEFKNDRLIQHKKPIGTRAKSKNGWYEKIELQNIVAWSKLGEFCSKYFKKGQQVGVIGRIQTRTWDDDQGQKHYITEVVAEEAYFADSKRDGDAGASFDATFGTMPEPSTGASDFEVSSGDDLPF